MRYLIFILCLLPAQLLAEDRLLRLHAPEPLVESGLMQHILPRFSLKTQVRVTLVAPQEAQVIFGTQGRPVFDGLGETWAMEAPGQGPAVERFTGWLTSEIGRRAVTGFAPDGVALFAPPSAPAPVVAELSYDGDPVLGEQVSIVKCGRCHAVNEAGRKTDIGSTPSFFVLRAMADWDGRFAAFYALKPHAAFTQVADVTPPFPPDRPSPIAPVEMDLDELDAIMAYVAGMTPADLGAPIQHQ